MAKFQLIDEIVELSRANNWDEAKPEWELHDVRRAEEPRTCLCGHSPIIELCILQNKVNGMFVTVGNHCVRTVLGLPSGKLFQAFRRVRADPHKSLNKEAILHAYNMGWVSTSEHAFYSTVMRKRKLGAEQLEQKLEINERFIRCMQSGSEPDDDMGHDEGLNFDEDLAENLHVSSGCPTA